MIKDRSPEKIRIFRLLSRMNVGGPSRHAVHLVNGLDKLNYQTMLAVGLPESAEGSMLRLAEESNIRAEIIACFDRPVSLWRDLIAFSEIVRHIREFRPHIVHTHTTKAGILGRIAAIICRVPIICHTYHGHIFSGYFSEKTSQLIVSLERILARFTDRLITLTPAIKDEMLKRFRSVNPDKMSVISLGLDLEKNLHAPLASGRWREKHGIPGDAFLMGMVARLVPVKNHHMMIQAMQILSDMRPNLHLALVGGGELEAALRKQVADAGLQAKVHFCGVEKEIEDVYSDLDLLVLSSKNEGTPVVIIEALASGCPVAATRVGGVEEVLEHGRRGFLLSQDPDQFVRDLGGLLSEKKLQRPDEMKRREIAGKYSIDSLVTNMHNLYSKILLRRGIK